VHVKYCKIEGKDNMSLSAREKGESGEGIGDTGMFHCTEIGEIWRLSCGAPTRNLAGLAARFRERGREVGEEEEGYL
jgi:hypothetical protein